MADIREFQDYLDASVSAYHVAGNLAKMLDSQGYTRLREQEEWHLEDGGKYYFLRGDVTLLAFRIPKTTPRGFMMGACHTDRPTFKIKENCEHAGAYVRLMTEGYGGMLISTWLDRPLSVAGRVMVETETGIAPRRINLNRDLLMIPSVAIHMNRAANDGYKWNLNTDTVPLAGLEGDAGKFWTMVEEAAGGHVLGHDLYLYVRQPSTVWGVNDAFISGPALDDLACVWGTAQGFLNAGESEAIPVLCAFDSEEVGSDSPQGAASDLLEVTLERICRACHLDLNTMLAQSFMISADNAHAMHPNHPELADSANAPVLGKGVVLKFNASQRYTTDGVSAAIFRKVCALADVPVQTYANRPDIRGGSTLGHISLSHVSVPTADIGLPQLAMHSCYETAAVADVHYLEKAMEVYYAKALTLDHSGTYRLG